MDENADAKTNQQRTHQKSTISILIQPDERPEVDLIANPPNQPEETFQHQPQHKARENSTLQQGQSFVVMQQQSDEISNTRCCLTRWLGESL